MAEKTCSTCKANKVCDHNEYGFENCNNHIPLDVVEVNHGEWIKVSEKYPRYVCTACNHLFNNKNYNYCPCCGARMDGTPKERGVKYGRVQNQFLCGAKT